MYFQTDVSEEIPRPRSGGKRRPNPERRDPQRELTAAGERQAPAPGFSAARSLGWLSLGLGVAEVLAPAQVARLLGLTETSRQRLTVRLIGAGQLLVGTALLTRRRPLSRLAPPVNASAVPVRAVVTIARPAAEIYRLWRDFENLRRFMTHVRSVGVRDDLRSHWQVSATGRDDLQWDAVITEDRPDELIAWRSVPGADVVHAGEVRFVPAPGDRGTEVHLTMNVHPPGGPVGQAVGKLFHRLPEEIIAGDLKRLKQLMETGEIVKSDASIHQHRHPARPRGPLEST
jgi:uncharacterized membrane protein